MTIRVLIVDDSRFICARVREILEEDSGFAVAGVAMNGRQAVEMTVRLDPDVIIMDVDMPVMDGITAVKNIMNIHPCPILMFSAMTHVGAQATLDALSAGALDFLPKQLEDIDANRETAKALLRYRVKMVAAQAEKVKAKPSASLSNASLPLSGHGADNVTDRATGSKSNPQLPSRLDLLVIAASTGGPVAIQHLLTQVPATCNTPILLIQHMPRSFTKSFAERLNQLCHITVREACDGDWLQPGLALLAPGGMQLCIGQYDGRQRVILRPKQPGEIYSPCVDVTFSSLAELFCGHVLALILTGMGSDGRDGAMELKRKGARIWAQDEASSTVYGMPRAVVEANIADRICSLDEIANAFKQLN